MDEAHAGVGIKPDYIGSHTVDGAANAGSSVQNLQWQTSELRSQKIVAEACDAHKACTSANIASGTSDHKVNMNPECGASLNKVHYWLTAIPRNGPQTKVYDNVLMEQEREKWIRLMAAVLTRWGARHDETRSVNMNQCPLDIAIQQFFSSDGIDAALYATHLAADTVDQVLISP